MGGLLRDSHEGASTGMTFLQKFYAGETSFGYLSRSRSSIDYLINHLGRDEESVRIASP